MHMAPRTPRKFFQLQVSQFRAKGFGLDLCEFLQHLHCNLGDMKLVAVSFPELPGSRFLMAQSCRLLQEHDFGMGVLLYRYYSDHSCLNKVFRNTFDLIRKANPRKSMFTQLVQAPILVSIEAFLSLKRFLASLCLKVFSWALTAFIVHCSEDRNVSWGRQP